MKERPILFSGLMVRAILEGRKTVTRRPVKQLALKWLDDGFEPGFVAAPDNAMCPYGQPGDRLWVREAWAKINVAQAPGESWVVYRECDNRTDYGGPWKPSIHMFRRDSRILLEITAVRVERLQDISEEQAEVEGVDGCLPSCPGPYDDHGNPECDCMNLSYQESFQALWESISGAGSWNTNPWVWVVEFKRVEP